MPEPDLTTVGISIDLLHWVSDYLTRPPRPRKVGKISTIPGRPRPCPWREPSSLFHTIPSPRMTVSKKSRHIQVLGCSPSPHPWPSNSFIWYISAVGSSSLCTGEICILRKQTVSKPFDDATASQLSWHSTGFSSQSREATRKGSRGDRKAREERWKLFSV